LREYAPHVIRLAPLVLAIFVVLAVIRWLSATAMQAAARRRGTAGRRRTLRAGGYAFDRRTEQVKRDLKKVSGRPEERRSEMIAWLDAHADVEAYVEPKTVMSNLSVVLVDGDGEWKRFDLKEDRFLRQLAKERNVPVFDAARTGYPPRMRRGHG
jgi:hypothetical protein